MANIIMRYKDMKKLISNYYKKQGRIIEEVTIDEDIDNNFPAEIGFSIFVSEKQKIGEFSMSSLQRLNEEDLCEIVSSVNENKEVSIKSNTTIEQKQEEYNTKRVCEDDKSFTIVVKEKVYSR